MARDSAVTGILQAVPRRLHAGVRLLLLTLFGAPLVWGLGLAVRFMLASHFCFPGDLRRYALPGSLAWVWPSMVGLDVLSILAAGAAAVVSYRLLRPAGPGTGPGSARRQASAGRTRFLSIWGLLTAALFILIAVFDLVALWTVPVCA